jgi:hypothetical protein
LPTDHPRLAAALLASAAAALLAAAEPPLLPAPQFRYPIHDMNRPQPAAVAPGEASCGNRAGTAPSDAVVLFDGRDLSKWRSGNGEAKWEVVDGAMRVKPGSGDLSTREAFGDCQLHLEWMVPKELTPSGQAGANSGVFLMNQYEVQILQSFGNKTYPDGMAGALYGQYPPMVNACRPQGEWNTYTIIFRAPRFDGGGNLRVPATATVLLNGVLVQDEAEILGSTAHMARAAYRDHPDRLPIRLQDHDDAILFRNIWVRPLPERPVAE